MPSTDGKNLAMRIVNMETGWLRKYLEGISTSIQELVKEGDSEGGRIKCIKNRIQCVKKIIANLRLIKERVPTGNCHFALFYVMERLSEQQRAASSRRHTDDLQQIAEDLKGRIANYQRVLAYVQIARELMDFMSVR